MKGRGLVKEENTLPRQGLTINSPVRPEEIKPICF